MRNLSIGLSALALAAAFAHTAQAADVARGKATFQLWCEGCHAPTTGRDRSGTYILQRRYKGALPSALEERTDLTANAIKSIVRSGRSFMPRTRKTEISDEQLADLATYLAKGR